MISPRKRQVEGRKSSAKFGRTSLPPTGKSPHGLPRLFKRAAHLLPEEARPLETPASGRPRPLPAQAAFHNGNAPSVEGAVPLERMAENASLQKRQLPRTCTGAIKSGNKKQAAHPWRTPVFAFPEIRRHNRRPPFQFCSMPPSFVWILRQCRRIIPACLPPPAPRAGQGSASTGCRPRRPAPHPAA